MAEQAGIVKVFYPVFPPDRNAADVVEWLESRRAATTSPSGPGHP